MENESEIPFLDVELTGRSMHRKPTWNGQLTSFYSWIPIQQKRNLNKSLDTLIRRICSPDALEAGLDLLKEISQNGYPPRFIDKNVKPRALRSEVTSVLQNNHISRFDEE